MFTGATRPEPGMPAGYHQREQPLGEMLGGSMLGMSVYDLDPGEKTFAYHYELAEEEWLIVIEGAPTLREPGGERTLRPGDVVCFPVGPEGAHQVRNDTAELARVALISTVGASPTGAVFPDSGKVHLRAEGFLLRQRIGEQLEYWDGEA